MSKYKVGDKVVLTVSDVNEKGYCPYYRFNNNHLTLWKTETDEYTEPLSTYTESLEAEITRLLAENERLKDEYEKMYATIEDYESHESQGAETAWELARKITVVPKDGGYGGSKLIEIFNTALNNEIFNLTYPEAAAKVEAWERQKEKIEEDNNAQVLWNRRLFKADRWGTGMKIEELETRIKQLEQDNKQLKNRCWALTNGLMCQFCDFEEDCLHSKPKNDESKRKVRDRSNIYNQGR